MYKKDGEYEEIYDVNNGFAFNYNHRHVGKSRSISVEEMSTIDDCKKNYDSIPLYVYCVKCGTYMDYHGLDNDYIDGKWICPVCQVGVRETTIYRSLGKENQKWLMDNGLDNYDDDYDDYWPE